MKCSSPSRLDRLTHENFVSSLRTWCNSDDDSLQVSKDRNLEWVNSLSERLLVGAKVDLMKITSLYRLSKVEVEFLKLAVPNLIYFAKTQNSVKANEAFLNELKLWSGVPPLIDGSPKPANSILVNKLRFKNILMKLLSNESTDKRIRRMKQFILNPTELESSDASSAESTPCSSNTHKSSLSSQATPANAFQESVRDPLNNVVTPLSSRKGSVLTPNTTELLSGVIRRPVPKLHIEYIEPTAGLISTNNIASIKSPSKYHGHDCLSKEKNGKWVETLRGGYIPAHIHFNS